MNTIDYVSLYMRTWKYIKKRHPASLVLIFGADSFCHTIEQDAEKVAEICGTHLENIPRKTRNDYHTMFQKEAVDSYLPKLVRAGERVVICDNEQVLERIAPQE